MEHLYQWYGNKEQVRQAINSSREENVESNLSIPKSDIILTATIIIYVRLSLSLIPQLLLTLWYLALFQKII
jgi:hypothetical protein